MQKKLILLILLSLFISWGAHSQYKSYFGKEYTKWYMYTIYSDIEETFRFGILDNELIQIDEKEYQKVQTIWENGISEGPCYIREDRDQGRLYCLDKESYLNDGKEFLISDMSLQIGDTVYFPKKIDIDFYDFDTGLEENNNGYFTIVDSIYYKDDRKHIQTTLITHLASRYGFLPFTFIEGLGPSSSISFYFPIIYTSYLRELTCFETESEFWKNEKFWTQKYQGIPEKPENCILNNTKIYYSKAPNPFRTITSKIRVEVLFDNELTGTVRLYDINAREMITREIEKATSVILPIESLPKGSYILWVYDKRGDRVWSEKLVILTR